MGCETLRFVKIGGIYWDLSEADAEDRYSETVKV